MSKHRKHSKVSFEHTKFILRMTGRAMLRLANDARERRILENIIAKRNLTVAEAVNGNIANTA